MHIIGLIIALPLSLLFNISFLRKEKSVFYLEMPPYRKPLIKNIAYAMQSSGKNFIFKAGKVILIFSMIIWFLTYFPRQQTIQTSFNDEPQKLTWVAPEIENSYIGRIGQFIQPIFAPLGYDWKLTVGIISAFPARELIVSTLGIIYNEEQADEESSTLSHKLKNEVDENNQPLYNICTALSLMIFFALCSQCMSTLIVIYKELNSYFWPIFTFVYMTLLAYLVALGTYQVSMYLVKI